MNTQKLMDLIDKVVWHAKALSLTPTFSEDRALLSAKIDLRNYVLDEFEKEFRNLKKDESK